MQQSKFQINLSMSSDGNFDRSMQGQLFNESIVKCLKGDEDFHSQSCMEGFIQIHVEQQQNPTIDFLKNSKHESKQQNVQNEIFQKQEDAKIIKKNSIFNTSNTFLVGNENKINEKARSESQNEQITKLDKNKLNNEFKSKIETQNEQNNKEKELESQQMSKIQKEKQNSQKVLKINNQKTNKIATFQDQSIIQFHQLKSEMGKKSILNSEKASFMLSNVINKQMNKIQIINKHVKKFISQLQFRMNNRKMSALQDCQYKLLDDVSYYNRKQIKRKLIHHIFIFFNYITKLKIPLPVFMPTQAFRVYWDVFLVIFTYIFLFIYSILIFFYQEYQNIQFVDLFFQIPFAVFLLDFLLNLNTAFFNKDAIEINRKKIIQKYFSSHIFFTDAICLFVIGSNVIANYDLIYNPKNKFSTFSYNVLIFLKLNGLNSKTSRFSYVFILKENQKHILKLFNQLLGVITIAHIVCIAWYCLGLYEQNNGYANSWLDKYGFTDLSQIQKYIYSLYWSITTMTTVGYGDISATNDIEALFILISMILFSCVFAYSINNIGFILQEIEKSSKQLNENITTIQRYLNRKNVNMSLQSRVRHYLQFLTEEQKDRDQNAENQIFQTLSNKLRDEITIEVNTKILKNYSIFNANFSHQTIRKLLFAMQEVLISPNEIIFEEGDHEDQSIYFIESGLIEIYQTQTQNQGGTNNCKNKVHLIKQLTKNQVFGEISFFSGLARSACARSVNLSTLYKLEKQKFLDIIKINQEDFERFKMLEEQIRIQQDLSSVYLQCYACNTQGHFAKNCPYIHQIFDAQFINLQQNFSIFQERSTNFQRKLIQKKYNPRLYIKQNKNICSTLKEKLQNYNSYAQIMMQSEIDLLSITSEKKKQYQQEYQSTFQSQPTSFQNLDSRQEIQEDLDQPKLDKQTSSQNDKIKNSKARKISCKTPKSQKRLSSIMNEENKQDCSQKELENLDNTNSELSSINKNQLHLNNFTYIQSQIIQQEDPYQHKSAPYLETYNDKQNRQSIEKIQKQQDELNLQATYNDYNENKQRSVNSKFQDQSNRDLSSQIYLEKIEEKQKIKSKNIPIQIKFQGSTNNADHIYSNNMVYEEQIKSQLQDQNLNTQEKRSSNFEFLHSTNKLEEIIQTTPAESNLYVSSDESDQQVQNQKKLTAQNSSIFKKANSNLMNQNLQLLPQIINNLASKTNLCSQVDSFQQIELIDKISKFLNRQRDSYIESKQIVNVNENPNLKNLQSITENFDRIKNYKKFFPHNNFDFIFMQQKHKRNKKYKSNRQLGQKGKRPYPCSSSNFIRNQQNDVQNSKGLIPGINYELYKPTFLSYGVPQLSDSIYPKYLEKTNNITQSKLQN
ncbi:voltage and ligand gated potassium channel protein (macronuclear) [Tetrahymena thermophila SB210]|uniref:Voltage and ligand gated potassium channel protein n=1 Tax=Tetrahymena thermophila (strain SB210) TaxID=312017 RepID=A4VDK5_TETTS|nr:voltage and ligand gated potassium channel protein [Tetrahymena thermophila SB210]EDK31609.1 voltage and ligand gated potassium channel protein [Tetrahymena thermophila SB210]|eukprot:XP_001470858.1 voltage and ligand gated potassium channel protein [Tetrahymena thermophila SB210]